ncbi:MAG: alpha/beta fold hydrolase [Anaerolineales bacterium]|nr:alpha/beta fold hydrolase [Anaerolineales bacterium]
MPTLDLNGLSLYYETHGAGEPLILISGLGYDHDFQWRFMVPGLAERYQVIVFDNRGAGQSAKPAGPYTAQLLADDTAALLAALGHASAHVLGHSMGGFIAQALALEHPGCVRKLILAATNFGGPRHIPITAEAMAVLTDTKSDPLERLRRGIAVSTAPGWAEAHPERVQAWLEYRAAHPLDPAGYQAQLGIGLGLLAEAAGFEHRLAQVKAPTLVLTGAHDKVVPPGNAELLAARLPHSRVHVLPDAGHLFTLETPEAANQAILAFLE